VDHSATRRARRHARNSELKTRPLWFCCYWKKKVTHEQYFTLAFSEYSYVSFIHRHEFTTTNPLKTETDQTIYTHAYFFHVLPQREHDVSITKTNALIVFREIICIYYDSSVWHNLSADSVSKRNEYQEYFRAGKGGRCVRLTTLPPSCADCLEIWKPQTSWNPRACPGL